MTAHSFEQTKQEVLQIELAKLVSLEGVLRPEDIVAAARPRSHPLHEYFQWDDSAAAEAYRLVQAQALIRYVKITVDTPDQKIVVVRMFESLPSDRGETGYRSLQSIMSDKEKYAELLLSALAELESFRLRYQHLRELAGVVSEIERVRSARPRRAPKKRQAKRRALSKRRGLPRPRKST